MANQAVGCHSEREDRAKVEGERRLLAISEKMTACGFVLFVSTGYKLLDRTAERMPVFTFIVSNYLTLALASVGIGFAACNLPASRPKNVRVASFGALQSAVFMMAVVYLFLLPYTPEGQEEYYIRMMLVCFTCTSVILTLFWIYITKKTEVLQMLCEHVNSFFMVEVEGANQV